jgi:ferredoxin
MKKRFVLTFPPNKISEPLTYNLVKEFDIIVNILNADITPGKKGKLMIELQSSSENIEKAVNYFESLDISWSPAQKSIVLNENDCIHCGSCSAVCFADALTMDKISRELVFKPEKCIACELCLKACPLQLFELNFA